jgi:hypothetical protein
MLLLFYNLYLLFWIAQVYKLISVFSLILCKCVLIIIHITFLILNLIVLKLLGKLIREVTLWLFKFKHVLLLARDFYQFFSPSLERTRGLIKHVSFFFKFCLDIVIISQLKVSLLVYLVSWQRVEFLWMICDIYFFLEAHIVFFVYRLSLLQALPIVNLLRPYALSPLNYIIIHELSIILLCIALNRVA